ncbi:UNVERIFIED_CONTAM: protein FIP1 [Sesamum radiatum]|uniref:Protein FIP1 n=1 Tax=Sesamum radiatum TaxID=300843 RepID=A0AAW2R4S7_SESRA
MGYGNLKAFRTAGYVHQYNSLDSQPDVLNSLYSPLQQSSSLEGLRYHDGGRLSDQQMALLQYQRENLHFLSEEILRLQECLSKYERSDDGSTPQVLWLDGCTFKACTASLKAYAGNNEKPANRCLSLTRSSYPRIIPSSDEKE